MNELKVINSTGVIDTVKKVTGLAFNREKKAGTPKYPNRILILEDKPPWGDENDNFERHAIEITCDRDSITDICFEVGLYGGFYPAEWTPGLTELADDIDMAPVIRLVFEFSADLYVTKLEMTTIGKIKPSRFDYVWKAFMRHPFCKYIYGKVHNVVPLRQK